MKAESLIEFGAPMIENQNDVETDVMRFNQLIKFSFVLMKSRRSEFHEIFLRRNRSWFEENFSSGKLKKNSLFQLFCSSFVCHQKNSMITMIRKSF